MGNQERTVTRIGRPLPKLMSNLLKKQGVPQEVYSTLSQSQAGMLIGNLMQRHRKGFVYIQANAVAR